MLKIILFTVVLACGFLFLFGHEEHNNQADAAWQESSVSTNEAIGENSLIAKVGSLHLILLHFPIALIFMTVVSEFLFVRTSNAVYDHASRFMLVAAAITAIPTAIFGLIYSYAFSYTGESADTVFWHMWFGISTAILAIVVSYIREYVGISRLYYFTLFILFLIMNITGYFGGVLTFGHLL